MARFVEAAVAAAAMTGGLVDPTLVTEIERAGYAESLDLEQLGPRDLLRLPPRRSPGRPRPQAGWREVRVDRRAGTADRDLRLKRALARDGPEIEEPLRHWMVAEDGYFARSGTAGRVDRLVDGVARVGHDPESEYVRLT